jgi:hypothetical protein
MNNKKLNIAAFSIMETIISMVITALIISIVFVLFSILTERLFDIKKQNQLVNDLNRLSFAINKDIFENEKMMYLDSSWTFVSFNLEDTIKYQFRDSIVIRRKNEFIDTLGIKVIEINRDSVWNKSKKIGFTKIKLSIEIDKRNTTLHFYKRVYSNERNLIIKE